MTEKQFQYNVHKNSIEYDGKHFAYCNWQQGKIANKLNMLNKENEQLKADNNRLVNETAKVVAEHQKKVLDLINKRIDKCKPTDYVRNIKGDVPVFDCETATEIRVLNELKMELSE